MTEFYHHGIKGMKWGIRRYQNEDGSLTDAGKKRYDKEERKAAKKEVKTLSKGLVRSGQTRNLASMAALSKFGSKDYDQLSRLVDSGRLAVKARFKNNYAERSVDLYIGNEKNPTIRARLTDGKRFTATFLNRADQTRYEEFADYYKRNH